MLYRASCSVEALVVFSLDKLATEKSLGSDTLLFCAPETLFFLSGELRLERPDFLREL